MPLHWLARLRAWVLGIDDPLLPLGKRGERAAARYLRRKGLKIIAAGAADAMGEIDLIAVERRPQRRIVFVEVKTRSSESASDHPADRVDADKQRRLTRAALAYLKRHRLLEYSTRFDVVAVWWPSGSPGPSRIEHYPAAFEATGTESFFS